MSAYLVAKKHIPDLLKQWGPLPKFRIGEMLDLKDRKAVGRAIDQLCEECRVKRLGRADDNGIDGVRGHAIMFALPEWKPKSRAVAHSPIANGEFAHATSRTFPQYVYPGKGSRRGL